MSRPKIFYTVANSPLGPLLVAGTPQGLTHIGFQSGESPVDRPPEWQEDRRPFLEVLRQLAEYFEGRLKEFHLPLAPRGSRFQKRVWRALRTVPYGATTTYGEVARQVDRPKAARAVGGASRCNPLPIVIPCHRVVGKGGALTGFSAGLAVKKKLLTLERTNRDEIRGPHGPGNER